MTGNVTYSVLKNSCIAVYKNIYNLLYQSDDSRRLLLDIMFKVEPHDYVNVAVEHKFSLKAQLFITVSLFKCLITGKTVEQIKEEIEEIILELAKNSRIWIIAKEVTDENDS